MKLIIILSSMIVLAACQSDPEKLIQNFFTTYDKVITNPLKLIAARFNLRNAIDRIDAHNKAFLSGTVSYQMGLYSFSDEDPDKVVKQLCKTYAPPTARAWFVFPAFPVFPGFPTFPPATKTTTRPQNIPASKDWTSVMMPVVDQGKCGSCWSFAAIAQVESLYKRRNPAFNTPLSTQYLVDCSRSGNNGCDGGWPKYALDYLKANGPVAASNYGYTGVQSSCKRVAKLSNQITNTYEYTLNGDETVLKNLLDQEGPLAIAIHVTNNMLNYKGGVFQDYLCPTSCSKVNHGVVLVGYGTDAATGKDYWLVRNSWGPTWGEKGYIRMARNRGNNCLTACSAMYSK